MEQGRINSSHGEGSFVSEVRSCQHCRAPIESHSLPFNDSKGREFCCIGCRAVFQLLEEKGLTYFYTLTEKLGGQIPSLYRSEPSSLPHTPPDHAGSTARLALEGIQCASCVWLLERLPDLCTGVLSAKVRLSEGDITVNWDPSVTSLDHVIAAIEGLGYRLHIPEEREKRSINSDREALVQLGVAAACAMNVMVLAVSLYQGLFTGIEARFEALFRWASLALSIPAVGYSALPIYKRGLAALRAGSLHIDIPITLGILLSFVLSAVNTVLGSGEIYFDSVTTIIFLLLATRYLHHRAFDTARRRCTSRWFLLPSTVREVLPSGEEREAPISSLRAGILLAVRAGERIPCDGVIERGATSLDCSTITGESFPQEVSSGSAVLAGSLNLESPVIVRSATERGASRLDRILATVSESIVQTPTFITKLDTLSMLFTSAALLLGVGAFLVNISSGLSAAASAAIAMLTVTCPCAIALALPLLSMRALSTAATHGLLVRAPSVFEDLPNVTSFFLDKTGTLTRGEMTVQRVVRDSVASEGSVQLLLSALIAVDSTHPVSRALNTWVSAHPSYVKEEGVVSDLKRLPGRGVSGIFRRSADGLPEAVMLSSLVHFEHTYPSGGYAVHTLLDRNGIAQQGSSHTTMVVLAINALPIALFELTDSLRDESRSVINEIKRVGACSILSGDRAGVVYDVAAQLGIPKDHAYAELLPEDKAELVTRAHGASLFAGDGANDAPALAKATIGVALRGGIQSILECADVFVASGSIESLVTLRTLAARYRDRSRLLVGLGLTYNALGIAAAFMGYVTPLVAAVAMPTFSSIVVFLAYSAFWGLETQHHERKPTSGL